MISAPLDRWFNDTEESNLQQQLATLSLLPKNQPDRDARSSVIVVARRPTSLQMGSRSRATLDSREASNLPTLTTISSRSSGSTVHTSDANISIAPLLEDDSNSIVQDRESYPPYIFGCPFSFLDCHLAFPSFNDWVSHSLSHFGGFAPPTHALCAFCDDTFDDDDGVRCWQNRMHHVADHHLAGFTVQMARPDYHLFRYLRSRGLMTQEDFRHLCEHSEQPQHLRPRNRRVPTPNLSDEADGYIVKHNPRRESRRRAD
ncbi:MAG: hypothetical protein M1835_005694 [Candelina submexicana]|nr:MAG: hypothetical protein M1835_005694 [Candelina submexicana]